MAKTLLIVIGCDTDPDRQAYLGDSKSDELSWRGMLDGIPRLKESINDVQDSHGNRPRITWCLRADYQIKETYGTYSHILQEHKKFLLDLENDGDELAWHPHFWNFDKTLKCWYQDFMNTEWQVAMLEKAHQEYQQELPGRGRTVRMGWDYHNNETYATLERLGIEVDFSGIPGLKIDPKNDKVRAANFFDWLLSPNRPYYPARVDYRREAREDETSFELLESPNFVSKSLGWSLVRGFALGLKMKDPIQILRCIQHPSYWIGITGKPWYFSPLISQLKRTPNKQKTVVFVTYFHPDELLPNLSKMYSLENMVENLRNIVLFAHRQGFETRFIRAQEIPDLI